MTTTFPSLEYNFHVLIFNENLKTKKAESCSSSSNAFNNLSGSLFLECSFNIDTLDLIKLVAVYSLHGPANLIYQHPNQRKCFCFPFWAHASLYQSFPYMLNTVLLTAYLKNTAMVYYCILIAIISLTKWVTFWLDMLTWPINVQLTMRHLSMNFSSFI